MAEEQENERPPLRKRIERATGSLGLRLVVGPLRAMPPPMARAVGRGIGTFLFSVLGRYRRVALKNLALVYGEQQSPRERGEMARAVFQHFGVVAAEFVKMPQLTRDDVDTLVTVEGEENLRAARAQGKGVLIITGHFGNWEFLARWFATHEYPVNAVARDARDPTATRLLADTRTGSGARILYRGNSARGVLQALKKNELVCLLPDQNAADVFVPFFGHPTGTVDGPARIHLKTGAPLVFSWCVRTSDNRFHILFEPPVIVPPTGDQAADVSSIMALINARLEAQVRRHPTQWLWLHDRWKASPDVFARPNAAPSLLQTQERQLP